MPYNIKRIERATEQTKKSSSRQRLRFWLSVMRVSKFVQSNLRRRFRSEFNSSLPRFDVMAALAKNRLKMTDISAFLRVSHGNVTHVINSLVKEGIVIRSSSSGDKRATFVELTTKGEETFATLANAHKMWIDELFADIDDAQLKEMTSQMRDVISYLEGGDDETS